MYVHLIIHRRRSEYCRSRGGYSTIFAEPEENNRFSIIAQVIIRATAFSFTLRVSFSNTSRNHAATIVKLVLQYYNHLVRGDYIEK